MTLRITLTVDQENEQATVLIGLLAKALGRGEAGVSEFLIETVPSPAALKRSVASAHISRIAAKVAAIRTPRKRQGLGSQLRDDKPNSVRLTLKALWQQATLEGIKTVWSASGLSANGVGATLSKMRKRGLVKRVSEGVWRLTPAGEELHLKFEGGQDGGAR